MAASKPKKLIYTLKEVVTSSELINDIDDLFCYVKDEYLQICKLHPNACGLFLTDEEINALSCQYEPIPIDYHEAIELYKRYSGPSWDQSSLVITCEEIKRFNDANTSASAVDSEKDEPDITTHPQEKLPTVLMSPDDYLVWTYEKIGKIVNCHKDNVLRLHNNEGLPVYWSASNPYSTYFRLVSWVENREGMKRKTAKNFTKPENPQER